MMILGFDGERRHARLSWRAVSRVDYWVTLTRLRIIDAPHGPVPESIGGGTTGRIGIRNLIPPSRVSVSVGTIDGI